MRSAIPQGGILLLLAASHLSAATHYVSLASTNPTPPYTNWATAATRIQDAVNVASTNDVVLVTNGIYPGAVTVTNPLTLRSVQGPQFTIVDGGGTNRCCSLSDGASLTGFTLTYGVAPPHDCGGAVVCRTASWSWLPSTNALLTNCIIVGNWAAWGGGTYGGTLYNCTLTGNQAGAFPSLCGNCGHVGYLCFDGGMGGGAYGSALYNCALSSNSADNNGGGACEGTLYNCTLTDNSAGWGGGASTDPWPCVASCTLYNCTLIANSAAYGGGGAAGSTLYNSTVVGNAGSYCCGGASSSALYNSIVYFNSSPDSPNYDPTDPQTTLNYCDTTPPPIAGTGSIDADPLFVDTNGWSNLRLQSNSPCINIGNNSYLTNSDFTNCFDLDGRPRVVDRQVDMGAYEFQPGISGAFIAWLQQYALPTDGSADFIDVDVDGHNNWQEWVCGTCPTNARSALCLLSACPTGTNVIVSWQNATGINYFLERSANPAMPFTLLASNIVGQAANTSYADTNAIGSFFYRVGVKCP